MCAPGVADKCRVDEFRHQLAGGNMMEKYLVTSTKRNVLTILSQRQPLNGSEALRQSPHLPRR